MNSESELDKLLWEYVALVPFAENINEDEKAFAIDRLKLNLKEIDLTSSSSMDALSLALSKSTVPFYEFENDVMQDIIALIKDKLVS
jgi:hypothetical protein